MADKVKQQQHTRSLSGYSLSYKPKTTVATPEEYVAKCGGKRVIEKVLVANNGIGAVKFIRSVRRWAYEMFGNEKAIKFCAMVSPEDLKANAEFIKLADNFIPVPGGSNNHNYANVDLILDIAKRVPVQAVWAGWGHASENPKLPELLHKNNIIFLGPPAKAMWALGDKIASSIVAQTASVPTLPWSGSGLTIDFTEEDLQKGKIAHVPDSVYKKGCIQDAQHGIKVAEKIGFPVMIKASEGGGGKGIRKATNKKEFPSLYNQVQAEVPGSPVFVMKLANNARHVEVQLIADQYGNAISLFGRDCSVQRRHQKIIEEAPAAITDPVVFERMEKSAVRLAKMVGYVSAGTVEYLYHDGGEFHFLELNPRLQVEHPCTEMVADVNLPALQLQVGMGIPLHCIRDIRRLYKVDPWETTPIDFDTPVNKPTPHGHVIACRITAENPDEGFRPGSGTVQELNFHSSKNVWGYFSVSATGGLHEYADSQFGHCFAWGETREIARNNMVPALRKLSIRGDFRTTVEFLSTLLETQAFHQNTIDTGWLDRLIAEKVKSEKPEPILGVICATLCIAEGAFKKRFADYQILLERGQVMNAELLSNVVDVELIYSGVKYTLKASRVQPTTYGLVMNGSLLEVEVHCLSDGSLLLSLDGASYTTYMREEVDKYRVVVSGRTCEFDKENDPTKLRATSPGKLLHYLVEDGGSVSPGAAYAEIEVMKMVTTLTASVGGTIHHVRRPGAILHPGTLVATLDLDDSSQIQAAQRSTDTLPQHKTASGCGDKVHQVYQSSKKGLLYLMAGFGVQQEPFYTDKMTLLANDMLTALKDPTLPLMETKELLSTISSRIPHSVDMEIGKCLTRYAGNLTSILSQFPTTKIENIINRHAATLQRRADHDQFFMNTNPIMQLVQKYRHGMRSRLKATIVELLREYYRVEEAFQNGYEKGVQRLRVEHSEDMAKVSADIFAHYYIVGRNTLAVRLIGALQQQETYNMSEDLKKVLLDLASLNNHKNSKVALSARQVLIAAHQPPYELRYNQVESIFLEAIDGNSFQADSLEQLIKSDTAIFDILPSCFYHRNKLVRVAALEVYVRRSYTAYDVTSVQHDELEGGVPIVQWQFLLPLTHPNRLVAYRRASMSSLPVAKVYSLSEDLMGFAKQQAQGNVIECQRTGIMAAFSSFENFEGYFGDLMDLFTPEDTPNSPAPITSPDLLSSIDEHTKDDVFDGGITMKEIPSIPLESVSSNSSTPRGSTNQLPATMATDEPIHIINIGLYCNENEELNDILLSTKCHQFVQSNKAQLHQCGIRRISFLFCKERTFPKFFTFRARSDFTEDTIYRHLEPALAFQLEINRLSNFDIQFLPCQNHRMHLYLGSAKVAAGLPVTDHRFFIRTIIRHSDFVTREASYEYMWKEGERMFLECLDQLEVANAEVKEKIRTDCNHIFLHFVPPVILDPRKIQEKMLAIVSHYGVRLYRHRVTEAEIKCAIRLSPNDASIPIRVFITSDNGVSVRTHMYREVENPRTKELVFENYDQSESGSLNGQKVNTPYPSKDHLQQKRYIAQSMGTTYVYDFLELFRQGVMKQWERYIGQVRRSRGDKLTLPNYDKVLNSTELVLDDQGVLREVNRVAGENEVAMVAWRVSMLTPQYPEGRDMIIIANDITNQIGSFGPEEDRLFQQASALSREQGIPRLYIAANSGARIGLAEELKQLFQVAWVDEQEPDKGFKYLYLSPTDYMKVNSGGSVLTEHIEESGESRYKITDIIGKKDGLGVENLSGSGMIAGETSQAYNDVFTINLVTCRAIGIGAYLVRLGQRVIQVENSHIILTGAGALNKVLGREVYSSNAQLGGIQIMHNNGVTHRIAPSDVEGVFGVLDWLAFVPMCRGGPLPVLPPLDPVDRCIEFLPTKAPYNPRHLITGHPHRGGVEWVKGFFDEGSFIETLDNWAMTVVCGRARLGGIPCGVIAVETRSVECTIPADPANPSSESTVLSQAGLSLRNYVTMSLYNCVCTLCYYVTI
ncbi:acetyl-CoA carboxylase-like isoform X2 [Halichondria panicea]|uniref:acetyl-CoA carboxylase-like isoform X2 n=1 Tax=Halichondria panicea TaxID=6063 RepID=UPI00312BC31B